MADEYFDVVNERDEPIGRATRREVHARRLWHRAVHILVFDSAGRIFLQKRSMKKDMSPGLWDSSCAGHVDAGEDYNAAAVRELGEELGITLAETPERWLRLEPCPDTGWEFCWIYRCSSEGPLTLHPDEIETGAWFAPDAVTQWVRETPGDFASAFVLIWQTYLPLATV